MLRSWTKPQHPHSNYILQLLNIQWIRFQSRHGSGINDRRTPQWYQKCGAAGSKVPEKKPCPEAVDHLSIVLVFCSRSWSSIRISSAQLCSSNLWWPPEWPVSYTVWLDRLKLPSTPPTPKINEPGVLSLGPKISLASLVSSSKNRCCRNALGPAMGSSIRIHHALCYMNRLNLSHR